MENCSSGLAACIDVQHPTTHGHSLLHRSADQLSVSADHSKAARRATQRKPISPTPHCQTGTSQIQMDVMLSTLQLLVLQTYIL